MSEERNSIKSQQPPDSFFGKLVIANVGIQPFYGSLKLFGAEVYQVDWSVPAGGDQKLINLLDKLVGG